ncbi:hypothetical protein VTN00DRAFT_2361 [Thermoascus crustaceus]|uniref:uncharacterized protein n=1 Tax=Thermoascus crustaceus TaxID=5088 RepID=UPI003742B0E6
MVNASAPAVAQRKPRRRRTVKPGSTDHRSAAEIVYRLLTYPELDYPDFATTARPPERLQPDKENSLEFIHNLIHNWTGCKYNGHMADVPVAGFDPIFWLHYCNVDRLLAIWQELNPNKWWTKVPRDQQDAAALPEYITPDTPLRPFHMDRSGTTWTSNVARQFMHLGYTYPELQPWSPEYKHNREKYIKNIRSIINEKYGINRKHPKRLATSQWGEGIESNDTISVRYSKFGLGGHPFNISIHLAPGDLTLADPERDHVADVYNFSSPSTVNGQQVCGKLCQVGGCESSLEEEDVEPLLKRLYWRITKYGVQVPRSEMEKIKIDVQVSRSHVKHYEDSEMTSRFRHFRFMPSPSGGPSGALDPVLEVEPTAA